MKPLGKSYNIFVLLCILPLDPGANKWVKFRNISFAVSTFLGLFFALIASIFFVEYNILTSLSDALYGVLQVAPISGVLYTTIIAHVLRDDIEAVFVNFQKFYDSSNEYFSVVIFKTELNIFSNLFFFWFWDRRWEWSM